MVIRAKKYATYEDVFAAPPHKVAEIIDGDLADDARVRAKPFDALALGLGALWADVEPPAP